MSNILFVNERCGYFGGVEQNIADTVKGLSKRGHRCSLAYGILTDRNLDAYQSLFADTIPCKELMVDADETTTGQSFKDILTQLQPDILYLHKVQNLKFCEPYLDHYPTLRMVHDHDLCCPRKHKYLASNGRVCNHKADWRCYLDLAFLERDRSTLLGMKWTGIKPKIRAMKQSRQIKTLLVASLYMQNELLQNGFDPEHVHILPYAVPFEEVPSSPVSDSPHIVYVGQLIRGKGVDLLLRALEKITIPFEVTIAGTGNAELALKAQSETLGLSDRVTFVGWVPHEGLNTYYQAARMIVVPSRWPEPFGMIGLEAMRHGRPVIGFDVGGIPDWLIHEKTGFLVPEQNITKLASCIERLLLDKELATTFGQNGLEHVKENFVFNNYLDKVEHFLESSTT